MALMALKRCFRICQCTIPLNSHAMSTFIALGRSRTQSTLKPEPTTGLSTTRPEVQRRPTPIRQAYFSPSYLSPNVLAIDAL